MKKTYYWITGILTLIGLVGMGDRLVNGLLSSATGAIVVWGLWVAMYIFFIGLSAGAFLISTLVYVFGVERYQKIGRLSLFTALICLIAALLSIWLDIGHMFRFWEVYTRLQFRSPMTWMVWLYTAYFILLLAELYYVLRADFIREAKNPGFKGLVNRVFSLGSQDLSEKAIARDRGLVKVLGSLGVPLAVAFHGGVGFLFAALKSKPFWFSGLLPVVFLVSALLSGGALLTFIYAFSGKKDEEHDKVVISLSRIVGGLLVFDLLLLFSETLVKVYGAIPHETASYRLLLSGSYAWLFWGVYIFLGALVPLYLIFGRRTVVSIGWGCLLIVLAFVAVRWNIVIPGQAVPAFAALPRAYADQRITTVYLPTLLEWLTSVGIAGLALLLYGLGKDLLPIEE